MMAEPTEIETLESIAVNLRNLIESDLTSVDETEVFAQDLKDIEEKIQQKKVEDVMAKFPQIEIIQVSDTKCGNCGDEKILHNNDGPCVAFGTCKCKRYIPITLDSIELPFHPGDIEN